MANMLAVRPKRINDRLMTVRNPFPRNNFTTLISAYAFTMSYLDELKDRFYEDLKFNISAVLRADKLIILGEFNDRVGKDHMSWEEVMGNHTVGKCNSNSLLLLMSLPLIFSALSQSALWMHPRSKHCYLFHYFIVRRELAVVTRHRRSKAPALFGVLFSSMLKDDF